MAEKKQDPAPLAESEIENAVLCVRAENAQIASRVLDLVKQLLQIDEQRRAADPCASARNVLVVVENHDQMKAVCDGLPGRRLSRNSTCRVRVIQATPSAVRGEAPHDIVLAHPRLFHGNVLLDHLIPILGNNNRGLFVA